VARFAASARGRARFAVQGRRAATLTCAQFQGDFRAELPASLGETGRNESVANLLPKV